MYDNNYPTLSFKVIFSNNSAPKTASKRQMNSNKEIRTIEYFIEKISEQSPADVMEVFLKILLISLENECVGVSFFKKVAVKRRLTNVFLCKFHKMFQNTTFVLNMVVVLYRCIKIHGSLPPQPRKVTANLKSYF